MTIKKHIKFLSIGMVAVSTTLFVGHNLTHSLGQQEAQAYFNGIQQNEELPTQTQAVHQDFTGSWARYLGEAKAQVNLALATTNILKIFAPTDYFKADTKGVYIFTALHEFSHAQLYRMLEQPDPVFRLGQTDMDSEQQKLVEQKMDSYMKNNRKKDNLLVQTFHENFADCYASILMIRDFAGRYNDNQIEQILQARYNQVHNQKTFLYGGFGDMAHRTDFSVHHVQQASFNDIRQMTPAQAKDFALKTATEGTLKQLTESMQALFQNKQFQENLTTDTLLKLNELVTPGKKMDVNTQAEFSSKDSGILTTPVNMLSHHYVSEQIGQMRANTLKVKSSMIKRG